MRIITFIASVVCGSALCVAFAMPPVSVKAPVRHTDKPTVEKFLQGRRPAPAPVEAEIIYEVPEGEVGLLSRDCDAFYVEAFEAVHEKVLGSVVRTITAENGDIYIGNPISHYYVESWIKASRNGDTVTIEGAQPIYEEWGYDDEPFMVYLVPMQVLIDETTQRGTFVATEDLRFDFKVGTDGNLVAANPELLLGACACSQKDDGSFEYVWLGYGDRDLSLNQVTASSVEPPASAPMLSLVWEDRYEKAFVKAVVDGEDIYLSGMDRMVPDAWIKGVIADGKAVFPSGQYLGVNSDVMYFSYFCGAEFTAMENPETGEPELYSSLADSSSFTYDAENMRLVTENGYVINSTLDRLYPLYHYDHVEVFRQERNPESVPAAPYKLEFYGDKVWVQIPNTDVDGNLLDADNLYYEILFDGIPYEFAPEQYFSLDESVTKLPYRYDDGYDVFISGVHHTVYLYGKEDFEGVVGVRSIYINEEGKSLYSDICTNETTAIDMSVSQKEVSRVEWYDIAGHRLQRPAKGLMLRTTVYTDGSSEVDKVVVR